MRRLIPASLALLSTVLCVALAQQSTPPPAPKPPADTKPVDPSQVPEEAKPAEQGKQVQPGKQVEEPPEEDETLIVKPCTLNPLEADRNITAGEFYYKKGNYLAAANRFRNATCWDPSSAEAFLRLGEADEKMRKRDAEREAYEKYLELAPQAKNVQDIKKKLSKLPPAPKN